MYTKGFKCSPDNKMYNSKPQDEEIVQINNRIAYHDVFYEKYSFKPFAETIGIDGVTFCPATFKKGKRNKENFEQMQLFVLDFDKGISFEEVKKRADDYDLPILFAYDTFSSINHDRFRVVFLNDVSIAEIKVAEIMQNAIMAIFPESDSSCKDVSKMYFGGNNDLLYFDESIHTINIYLLIKSMTFYFKNRYGATHYREKIARFARENGVALDKNGMLAISIVEDTEDCISKNSPLSSIYINSNGDNLPKVYYKIYLSTNNSSVIEGSNTSHLLSNQKKSKKHGAYRSYDLQAVETNCELFREFETGSRRLHHMELFGLLTNLLQIDTGAKLFKNTLRLHSYYDDNPLKYTKWDYDLQWLKQNEAKPYTCDKFCPHKDSCNHGTNILSTVKTKRRTTETLFNAVSKNFVSLEEAYESLVENFILAVNAKDNKIHAINGQVALGKSTMVIDFMEHTDLKYLMAVPTNDLKNELYEKIKDRGIKIVKSPSLQELKGKIPDNIWNKIEELYKMGKYYAVYDYITKLLDDLKSRGPYLHLLTQFRIELKKFYFSNCHAITTHNRLQTLDYHTLKKYDVIIIDEDIIFYSFIPNQIEIPISELQKLLDEIDKNSELAIKIKKVLKYIETTDFLTLDWIKYDYKYDDISTTVDIQTFCRAEKFIFKRQSDENNLLENNTQEDSIVFFKPLNLNPNLKYIMLSATLDRKICNYFFGISRMTYYECEKARYVGTLNQYDSEPMSRVFIDKDISIFERIKKYTGNKQVITFKKYGKGDLYFGNTEGRDHLKGKNMDVIGTPHAPEWLYRLIAHTLGLHFDAKAKLRYQKIVHNGFSFWFMTYDDEVLRNIQFWLIKSELTQVIGRSRILRENCIVNLFSNFPLEQAHFKKSEYDKGIVASAPTEATEQM